MAASEHDSEQFISEPITPESGGFRTDLMSQELASLPSAFTWRGRRYEIEDCISHVKQSAHEGHTADGNQYLRRQTFEVVLNTGQRAKIYFERQAKPGVSRKAAKRRWFLYSITSGDKTIP
jgi:hypothetical protein